MGDDKIVSKTTQNQAGSGCTDCGSGCNCGASGISRKWKTIICLVVVIAAAIVLAYGVMQKAEAQSDLVNTANETDQINSSLWGSPIESLANLSLVASQKDAVFLYLPIKGTGLDENITKEVQSAVSKAQSKGMTIALFVLDANSEDYAQLTRQVPAPFILVVVKGCSLNTVPADISLEQGVSVVSGDISEENLLYGLVAASRPSTPCCVVMPQTNKSASTKCC